MYHFDFRRLVLTIRLIVVGGLALVVAGAYWKSRMPRERPPLVDPPPARAELGDYERESVARAIKFHAHAPDANVEVARSWAPKTVFVKNRGRLSTRVIYRIEKGGQDGKRRDALYTIDDSSPSEISDVPESAESHRANDGQFPCKDCAYAGAAGEGTAAPARNDVPPP